MFALVLWSVEIFMQRGFWFLVRHEFEIDFLSHPWYAFWQALYWRYLRNNKKELEHLIKSRQWRNAHILFMTTVAASLFLNCIPSSHILVVIETFKVPCYLILRNVHIGMRNEKRAFPI